MAAILSSVWPVVRQPATPEKLKAWVSYEKQQSPKKPWLNVAFFHGASEQKKTAQPQEKDPKDDLLDHWRTQAATIEPKPRRRRRWLAERRTATAKTTARQEASKIAPTESEARDRRAEIRNLRRLPS